MRLQAKDVVDYLNTNGMNCNFNPHLTGLYEAALKSSKSHLKRIIGTTNRNASRSNWSMRLIRGLSRPMSDDAEDLQALTPGHFLVGHSLWTFAEPSLIEVNPGRLSRCGKRFSRCIERFGNGGRQSIYTFSNNDTNITDQRINGRLNVIGLLVEC